MGSAGGGDTGGVYSVSTFIIGLTQMSSVRQQFSSRWYLYCACLFLLLSIGAARDEFLIAMQIGSILLTVLYYGLLPVLTGWRERFAFFFQPVLLTLSSSLILLFLEETLFKFLLIVVLTSLHAFFLFHLRCSRREPGDDMRKGMLDSTRVLTQVNIFFLALLFFAPLFYFNIRHGFLFAVPFLILTACLIWNGAWIEGMAYPQRLLTTTVFSLVLLEVTLAQLWLPSSYMVQALGSSVIFFFFCDWLIYGENRGQRSVNDRMLSFTLGVGVILCIWMVAQWR